MEWKTTWAIGLLVAGAIESSTAIRSETRSESEPRWESWTRLRLDARSVPLFRGHVSFRVDRRERPQTLETEAQARFFGARIARSRTLTRFDATSGRTTSFESYSKKRGRRFTFGASDYEVAKLDSADYDAPPEEWSVRWSGRFGLPETDEAGNAPPLFDYYGMLLHLGCLDLKRPGDESTLYVATTHGVVGYVIRVGERRSGRRTLRDAATGKRSTVDVRELRLRIAPVDPDASSDGFLGMEGETEIWVEEASKTLLEVNGKIPGVPGRVRLRLAELG